MDRRFEPSDFDRNNRTNRTDRPDRTKRPDDPFDAEDGKIIVAAMECMFTRQQDRGLKLLDSLAPEKQEHLIVVGMRLGLHIGRKNTDWDTCAKLAKKIIAAGKGDVGTWLTLARATRFGTGGSVRAAFDLLTPVYAQDPTNCLVGYELTAYATQMGQLDLAKNLWEKTKAADNGIDVEEKAATDPDFKPLLAALRSSKSGAKKESKKAKQQVRFEDVQFFVSPRAKETAKYTYSRPLNEADQRTLEEAENWKKLGNLDEALNELDRISFENLENLKVLKLRLDILEDQKKWDECRDVCETIVRIEHGHPIMQYHLALYTCRATGYGPKQAYEIMYPLHEDDPYMPSYAFQLARFACLMGDLKLAREWYDTAITMVTADRKGLEEQLLNEPDLKPLVEAMAAEVIAKKTKAPAKKKSAAKGKKKR